jgi:hypothetical protein
MESPARQLPAAGWMSHSWEPAITFVAACYAVTWLAWARLHSAAATGAFGVFLSLIFKKTRGHVSARCWHTLSSIQAWLSEEPT